MPRQVSPIRKKTAAILYIIAGVLFLLVGLNIFNASPGIDWLWLVIAVFFIGYGAWRLLRKT
jgi:hypothetical protein